MQDRREFFRSLIAGGAAVSQRPERRNRREHHAGERIYLGPMIVPERVAAIVAEHPAIKRTTHQHLVSRYAESGCTWLFRCQIPASRQMVGEIVRTPEGSTRVHCWSAANPGEYREPQEIIERKRAPQMPVEWTEYQEPASEEPPPGSHPSRRRHGELPG